MFVISAVLGLIVAIAFDSDLRQLVSILLVTVLYAAELLASLAAVRFCGYRLVRQTARQPGRSQVPRAEASATG